MDNLIFLTDKDNSLTKEQLSIEIQNGVYDHILSESNFLILTTDKGLVHVKGNNKDSFEIIENPVVNPDSISANGNIEINEDQFYFDENGKISLLLDSKATENSNNLITSGTLYNELENIKKYIDDKMSKEVEITENGVLTINKISSVSVSDDNQLIIS